MLAMAQANKLEALAKASERYNRAMAKREAQAQGSPEEAEKVARQASDHIVALANAQSRAAPQAQAALAAAIGRSSAGRDHAIIALETRDPARANMVAQETLARVMASAPVQAQEGLQRALAARAPNGRGAPLQIETQNRQVEDLTRGSERIPEGIVTGQVDRTPQDIAQINKGPRTENPRRPY